MRASTRGPRAKSRRLVAIPELLRLKARTTVELAERLGVPVRTIQRDLESLREEGEGISELKRGLYYIPTPPSSLNPVEALAVYTAARLLYHHSPQPGQAYRSALEKLAAMLPEPARRLSLLSSQTDGITGSQDLVLERVARAWFERRVLACEYQAAGGGAWRPRQLEVYFVEVNRENLSPYLIGCDRSQGNKVLTWKLSRLRNPQVLDEHYTIPPHFDPQEYLSGAWGIMGRHQGASLVKLRFAASAGARLLEGSYPGLTIELELPDGGLEVRVMVGHDEQGFPREILPWIRGWGGQVEVLEPQILRDKWLEEAWVLWKKFGDAPAKVARKG